MYCEEHRTAAKAKKRKLEEEDKSDGNEEKKAEFRKEGQTKERLDGCGHANHGNSKVKNFAIKSGECGEDSEEEGSEDDSMDSELSDRFRQPYVDEEYAMNKKMRELLATEFKAMSGKDFSANEEARRDAYFSGYRPSTAKSRGKKPFKIVAARECRKEPSAPVAVAADPSEDSDRVDTRDPADLFCWDESMCRALRLRNEFYSSKEEMLRKFTEFCESQKVVCSGYYLLYRVPELASLLSQNFVPETVVRGLLEPFVIYLGENKKQGEASPQRTAPSENTNS